MHPAHKALIRALATPGPEQTFADGDCTARYVPEMTIPVPEDAEVHFGHGQGHFLAGSTITFWPEAGDDEGPQT